MASNFTADQSGNLTHVDFWTTSNNAKYEVYIWDGYFGTELAHQTGNCQEFGYYSIPLNTPIPMDAGQQFTVGVNVTTLGYDCPIPVECEIPGTVIPIIQTNVSFIRHNTSDSWTDLADDGYNACLRARMVLATFNCTCGDICVNTSGWWRGGSTFNGSGTPIQAAVNNASSGDTICVAAGSYEENVNIGTAHLTLAGEGADVVNVTAPQPDGDHVFEVTTDYVNISGFNVTGAIDSDKAGIYVTSDKCNISNNIATCNFNGIYLLTSSNNTLTSNTASNNYNGIYLLTSSNYNTLTNNTASNNTNRGIYLHFSSNNQIYNNYFNNTYNAYDDENNIWNTTPTPGTNIFGGSWLGGNYWSDYAGADTNGDGLGDTLIPYNSGNITNGGDYYPLVTPGSAAPTSSGGGSGTYPPGWFGTPTPTVTAMANATATAAPPGDKVTPVPTKAKPAASEAATPAAEGTTEGDAKKSAPGFTAVFVIAGMLAVAYAMMRRRE